MAHNLIHLAENMQSFPTFRCKKVLIASSQEGIVWRINNVLLRKYMNCIRTLDMVSFDISVLDIC